MSSFSSLALLLVTVCCSSTLITCSWAAPEREDELLLLMDRFHRWMEQHNRSYPTADEELRRFQVYRRNVEHIEATNREGKLGYTLGEGPFTDLTSEEFLATYTAGRRIVARPPVDEDAAVGDDMPLITTRAGNVNEGGANAAGYAVNLSALPESIDWRQLGAVTPVKNQGSCGSCYAFTAVAAVEGLHQIKTGKLVTLSEQELVDCSQSGCSPGDVGGAYSWIVRNGGITTEADYPYAGKRGTCDSSKLPHHAVSISGYKTIIASGEAKLTEAVARQPVSVGVEASAAFQHYKSGVFAGPCGYNQNHAVTLVGYGTDAATGKKYWIVKNSYGPLWGMDGYILMERDFADRRGQCGLAEFPKYPLP